jgi:hypothetical protein
VSSSEIDDDVAGGRRCRIWGRDGNARALEGMAVQGPVLEEWYSFAAAALNVAFVSHS